MEHKHHRSSQPSNPTLHFHPAANPHAQQSILQSLISESSSPDSPPAYKYAVNSTIIQHQIPSTSTSAAGAASTPTPSKTLPSPPTSTASTSTTPDATGPAATEASAADETHPVPGGADDEPAAAAAAAGTEGGTSTSASASGGGPRRGMHSATGAYWNTEKDGMWSYKYEGGEARGFDVVICVLWMAV